MRKYFRTFSRREIYSAIFSSLLLLTARVFIIWGDLSDSYGFFSFLNITIPIFLTHRFYYIEHRRRNKLIGRIIQNLLLITFTVLLATVILFISSSFYRAGSFLNLIVFTSVIIILTEIALSIINRIILAFKWQIW